MKDRPILFSAPMARALLDGHKTQTRRIVKPPWGKDYDLVNLRDHENDTRYSGGFNDPESWGYPYLDDGAPAPLAAWLCLCPYGEPGDLLWVRETWSHDAHSLEECRNHRGTLHGIPYGPYYRADSVHEGTGLRWKPSIHMPKWASRITLRITDVRVQRLQEITQADARAEGITDGGCLECGNSEPCGCDNPSPDPRDAFIHLWMQINGQKSWWEDPWVWAITFDVLQKNVIAVMEGE